MANTIVLALIKNNIVINRALAYDISFGDICINDGICDRYIEDLTCDGTLNIGNEVP